MWQEIAVYIIGFIVAVYIIWKVYRKITAGKNTGDPCCGCSGCSLKDRIPREDKSCCTTDKNR